jgi:hypothetical protein
LMDLQRCQNRTFVICSPSLERWHHKHYGQRELSSHWKEKEYGESCCFRCVSTTLKPSGNYMSQLC